MGRRPDRRAHAESANGPQCLATRFAGRASGEGERLARPAEINAVRAAWRTARRDELWPISVRTTEIAASCSGSSARAAMSGPSPSLGCPGGRGAGDPHTWPSSHRDRPGAPPFDRAGRASRLVLGLRFVPFATGHAGMSTSTVVVAECRSSCVAGFSDSSCALLDCANEGPGTPAREQQKRPWRADLPFEGRPPGSASRFRLDGRDTPESSVSLVQSSARIRGRRRGQRAAGHVWQPPVRRTTRQPHGRVPLGSSRWRHGSRWRPRRVR